MLFLHEVHRVRGEREEEFEAAYRDEWMPALGAGDQARLLWYFNHAHGSGPSYNVVTITGVRDGEAWEALARRVASGDLREWARRLDHMRHAATGKLLLPVPWSPLQDLDLAGVPTEPAAHEPSMYMEDTGWPHVPLDDYVEFWGTTYAPMLAAPRPGPRLLEIEASFQVAHGAGRRPEAILLQKVVDHESLLALLTNEIGEEHKGPGSFMQAALRYRDQWESKLLRTSRWSPRF